MKREESEYAIVCHPEYGPRFSYGFDIGDYCNEEKTCWTYNNGSVYEYDPRYQSSLFVGTKESYKKNKFCVCDYEVYTYN